jgi:hypothetical protein
MNSGRLHVVLFTTALAFGGAIAARSAEARWWKGNLHTHSLWSDGDDYPEMIADWYKQNGYHFLALSDHNIMQEGQRWLELKQPVSFAGQVAERGGGAVLQKYQARFGTDWVEQREVGGKRQVRLKPLGEFRPFFEEPGRFLLIPSFELTSRWQRAKTATTPAQGGPVHINVTNPRDLIPPVTGDNALDVMQRNVEAVRAQREKTGQPMFPHINHPNFQWGITAEELMQVKGERFFEVYNGHPGVNNQGDETHVSMDRLWDIVLTHRLTRLGLEIMYGIAVDDGHHYHQMGIGKSNAGRGWVMVRANVLTPEAVVRAMEAGDFYATSGVELSEVKREGNRLVVAIAAKPGVTYVTQFIGTRKGYDPASEIMPAVAGSPGRTLPHRRYAREIGAMLAESRGSSASYTLRDDDIYVRAKIISSQPKANGSVAGEFETAWTQPLLNPVQ